MQTPNPRATDTGLHTVKTHLEAPGVFPYPFLSLPEGPAFGVPTGTQTNTEAFTMQVLEPGMGRG